MSISTSYTCITSRVFVLDNSREVNKRCERFYVTDTLYIYIIYLRTHKEIGDHENNAPT